MNTRGKGGPGPVRKHYTIPKIYGAILRRVNGQAAENIAKWGDGQDAMTLLPVLMEEVGEIARGVLEYRAVNLKDEPLRKGAEAFKAAAEAIQAAAVCVEIARVMEEMASECKARGPK